MASVTRMTRLDLALQWGQRAPERPRAGRDAAGEAGLADGLGDVAAAPGRREAARVDRVAGSLGHEVRFAGELRFVDLDAAVSEAAVDDDLVARPRRR